MGQEIRSQPTTTLLVSNKKIMVVAVHPLWWLCVRCLSSWAGRGPGRGRWGEGRVAVRGVWAPRWVARVEDVRMELVLRTQTTACSAHSSSLRCNHSSTARITCLVSMRERTTCHSPPLRPPCCPAAALLCTPLPSAHTKCAVLQRLRRARRTQQAMSRATRTRWLPLRRCWLVLLCLQMVVVLHP